MRLLLPASLLAGLATSGCSSSPTPDKDSLSTPVPAQKAIIIPDNATAPEKASLEYAIKFDLQPNDPEVKWIQNNYPRYLEWQKDRDQLCNDNGIDPERFSIKIDLSPIPNSSDAMPFLYNEHNPNQACVINCNPYFFKSPFNAEDRKAIFAHEIGHAEKKPDAQQNRSNLKTVFGENFGWLKPFDATLSETALQLSRDEESRADKVGAELDGGNVDPLIDALTKTASIPVIIPGTDVTIGEASQLPGQDHPTVSQRVARLKSERAEVRNAWLNR